MCKCNDSAYKTFIGGDYGHIITGNLNIVRVVNYYLHLRKLMNYGIKFRLPSCLSSNK